jgi:hypothetical protein
MITLRRQLLGLGVAAASSLLAISSAQALTGPTAIQIDGGPIGPLQLSGGVDGYGYFLSNTPSGLQSNGVNVGNALVELLKNSGVFQFTIEIGSNESALTLGEPAFNSSGHLAQTSITTFTTGPLYQGYVTIAPTGLPVTFSAGQLGSLEGYESGIDWNNPSEFTTAIFDVQNSNSRGVEAALTEGPVTATVLYGDGFDSGVFNVVQALVSYTIDSNDVANVYGEYNLGRTGPNTFLYGGGTTGLGDMFINSNMIGAYYSYTNGNLNLVPEVQYQYAKTDYIAGINKFSSDLGAALFGTYSFGTSPYSLGGWGEYYTSHGEYNSLYTPNAQAVGFALSPTWQYKDLFARANAGFIYQLNDVYPSLPAATGKSQFTGTLEAGLLF